MFFLVSSGIRCYFDILLSKFPLQQNLAALLTPIKGQSGSCKKRWLGEGSKMVNQTHNLFALHQFIYIYINTEYNGLYSEDMSSWIEKGLASLDTVKACPEGPEAIMDIPGAIRAPSRHKRSARPSCGCASVTEMAASWHPPTAKASQKPE